MFNTCHQIGHGLLGKFQEKKADIGPLFPDALGSSPRAEVVNDLMSLYLISTTTGEAATAIVEKLKAKPTMAFTKKWAHDHPPSDKRLGYLAALAPKLANLPKDLPKRRTAVLAAIKAVLSTVDLLSPANVEKQKAASKAVLLEEGSGAKGISLHFKAATGQEKVIQLDAGSSTATAATLAKKAVPAIADKEGDVVLTTQNSQTVEHTKKLSDLDKGHVVVLAGTDCRNDTPTWCRCLPLLTPRTNADGPKGDKKFKEAFFKVRCVCARACVDMRVCSEWFW